MKRYRSIVVLGLTFVALAVALGQLFSLRFSSGDIYPPYSTFRADPLGARAFFESLQLLPRREISRLLGPLPNEGSTLQTTLLFLSCKAGEFHEVRERDAEVLERFARDGGRLVIALAPERTTPVRVSARMSPTNAPATRRRSPFAPPQTPPDEKEIGESSLRERWGFNLEYHALQFDDNRVAQPVTVRRADNAPTTLPENLAWHSSVVLHQLQPTWNVVYWREDKPVLAERPWGRGTLVLSTDSFLFSNEALRAQRELSMLTWFVGDSARIWFDETHLGIEEEPGVATLARRYRLHGVAFGLVVLAGLFVWRTMATFLPRPEDPAQGPELVGRDSTSGFVNLLRRGLAPNEVLATCFTEWRRSAVRDGVPARKLELVEDRFAAAQAHASGPENAVTAYLDIVAVLAPKVASPKASSQPATPHPSNLSSA